MGFNRDQFKPTSMAAIKKQEAEAQVKRPSGSKNLFGKIEEGRNILRIFPCHPSGGGITPWEAHCVSWLPVQVKARDANNRVIEGQFEVKRKSVFNSKVHGNTPKDLVEEYLRLVKEDLFVNYLTDKAEQEAIWNWLTAYNPKVQEAIQPQDTWVIYASKKNGDVWGPVEQFDLKKTMKTGLNSIAAEYYNDDASPTSPDPFSDVNDGVPVVIKSGKDDKSKVVYTVTFAKVGEGRNLQYMDAPLSDDQLEQFLKLDSLHKIYVNSYRRRDFQLQLEGLQNVDDQLAKRAFKTKGGQTFTTGLSVFALEEFQALIDEMFDLYPEETTETVAEEPVGDGELPPSEIVATDELPWDEEDKEKEAQAKAQVGRTSPRQQRPTPPPAETPAPRRQQQQKAAPVVGAAKPRLTPKPEPTNGTAKVESSEVTEKRKQVQATNTALDDRIKKLREGLGKKAEVAS